MGRPFVSSSDVQRTMRLSIAEGMCWALMIGLSETYFVANAVRLGASPLELGLVVTLPLCLGAAGPLTALAAMRRLPRRKWLVTGAAATQAVVLAAIVAIEAFGRMTPPLLIAAVCLYNMAGQTAGTAWASWMGDIVPKDRRGRYFSLRNRAVQAASAVALVGGGFLLDWLEPGRPGVHPVTAASGAGFNLIFLLAVCFRLASATLLALSPEPSFRGVADRREAMDFLRSARGRQASRLLVIGAAFLCTVYLASPYFSPFMLTELEFTYLQYMAASVCVVLTKSLIFPLWGQLLDRRGARLVFQIALLMAALVPLPWVFVHGLAWVLVAQVLSGASWSAYEVSYFALMLESSTKSTRPYLFALQSMMNGAMQLLGGTVGGILLGVVDRSYRTMFVVSVVGRLLVAAVSVITAGAALPREVRERFALRIVGLRPHGGFGYRPIEAVSDMPAEEDGDGS